jgi:hypothetical protein
VILRVISAKSYERREKHILDTITDPRAIADIIGRQNAVLQSFPEESRSILHPTVIEEHGGEDIHVYQATGDYAEYRAFRKNCLSFAKYIVGGHSKKLNEFNNRYFLTQWLWKKK